MAKKRSAFPAKFEYTAPFENPASRAMSSSEVAPKPLATKSRSAASSTSCRVRAWLSARRVAVAALAMRPSSRIP
jgi:hypothetical protein